MTFICSDVKAQAFLDFFENNGIGDEDFRTEILAQLSRLSHCSGSDKGFYLSVVKGSKPTNLLEVMLLTQLSAVYDESFAAIERLQWAKSLEEKDLCVNAVTKLIRAFVALSEPLQRRNEKNITVQNVSVSDGGRAIVGTITHNAEQKGKAVKKSPLGIGDAHGTAMPIVGPNERLATPVPIIEPKRHRASTPIRRRRRA